MKVLFTIHNMGDDWTWDEKKDVNARLATVDACDWMAIKRDGDWCVYKVNAAPPWIVKGASRQELVARLDDIINSREPDVS